MNRLAVALEVLEACAAEGNATAAAGLLLLERGSSSSPATIADVAERCGRSPRAARAQLRKSRAVRHHPPSRPGAGRRGRLTLVGRAAQVVHIGGAESGPPSRGRHYGSVVTQRVTPSRGGAGGGDNKHPRMWEPGEFVTGSDAFWAARVAVEVADGARNRFTDVRRPCRPEDFAEATLGLLRYFGDDRETVERWWAAAMSAEQTGTMHYAIGHYLYRDPIRYAARRTIIDSVFKGWGVPTRWRIRRSERLGEPGTWHYQGLNPYGDGGRRDMPDRFGPDEPDWAAMDDAATTLLMQWKRRRGNVGRRSRGAA